MNEKFNAHPAQVELARVFSSVTLLGPPMDDKLLRLVAHLFTPEEAEVAQHLPFYYPRNLEHVAKRAKRRGEDIKPLLEAMGEKKVIYAGQKGYSLMPLIPGMFEYILMDGRDSAWHRKYAELLVDMFGTGYVGRYNNIRMPAVRAIPVQAAIAGESRVVSADLVSEVIDRHQDMGVANVCQCRQSTRFIGRECKRATPEDGCLIFGSFAVSLVAGGSGRKVSKEEMRDIVVERWEKKLVFMTGNVSPESPNAICTCCDCCCHALETVNHYQGRVILAAPHYLAQVDEKLCNGCGKCAKACNTYAHTWTKKTKEHKYDRAKCIGCGVCVQTCAQGAIKMAENPDYKPPSKSFVTLGIKLFPATAISGLNAKMSR